MDAERCPVDREDFDPLPGSRSCFILKIFNLLGRGKWFFGFGWDCLWTELSFACRYISFRVSGGIQGYSLELEAWRDNAGLQSEVPGGNSGRPLSVGRACRILCIAKTGPEWVRHDVHVSDLHPHLHPGKRLVKEVWLFFYHEGWKKIDFAEHIKKLDGVPALFIPGKGGSYKQVQSLAAESFRAYQGGPLKPTLYQEASALHIDLEDLDDFVLPRWYTSKRDWFSMALELEHLQRMVLDQYGESQEACSKEGAEVSGSFPTSVILVGLSMGGFVAKAAVAHPHFRMSAVGTTLTLSNQHHFSAASFHNHVERVEFYDSQTKGNPSLSSIMKSNDAFDPLLQADENSPNSTKSFSDSQLEILNHQHDVMVLHFLAMLMFVSSLVACLRRIGVGRSFPWFADAALCVGVILHGLCGSRIQGIDSLSFSIPGAHGHEVGLSLVCLPPCRILLLPQYSRFSPIHSMQ